MDSEPVHTASSLAKASLRAGKLHSCRCICRSLNLLDYGPLGRIAGKGQRYGLPKGWLFEANYLQLRAA
jgi:hypothetical protein